MRPFARHCSPWPSSLLPGSIEDAIGLLRRHVINHVDSTGAVRLPCRSRPLETALLLRLLQHTGQPFDRQARYLRTLPPGSDPFDLEIAEAAVRRNATITDELRRDVIAKSPHFTGARKQALLDGLFAILGDTDDSDPRYGHDIFHRGGLHSWAQVQVTALKGVLTGRLDDQDVHLLLATQRLPDIWEGNLLIHLFTLHALRRLPGTEQVVEEGVRKALRHIRADGGVPFVTDTDTWCTVTAGIALSAADAPEAILDRIADRLVRCQLPGGGWSVTDIALQTDVDDTSVALQFLQSRHRPSGDPAVERGLSALTAVRHAQGGFPTYVRDSAAEASMTVAALDAFTFDFTRHRRILMDGLSFLADEQLTDGTFPPDWSSSRLHTVFRAVLMASRIPDGLSGSAGQIARRALNFVLQSQNDDGGWGQRDGVTSDPISTSYAVMALCAQDDPRPVAAGARYLLRHQREDGSIPSVSDSIGPRPFVFRIPLLADIFALMALGHVSRRFADAGRQTGRTDPGSAETLSG
ncbi:prenyltransferase/squalene oxidase repeat-containing protein [Amycolatopsis sp. lyj-90]|uniref:prenyltransferase/squalene oxidase repeat-containing protein n=1 Tax=Amycolatopsis sp. lyj-90 TaxID=2789285 RepID=UPI00397B0734